jgi:hypothetical protein
MSASLSVLRAGRHFTVKIYYFCAPGTHYSRMLRPEGLGKLMKAFTSWGLETSTLFLVALCSNQEVTA